MPGSGPPAFSRDVVSREPEGGESTLSGQVAPVTETAIRRAEVPPRPAEGGTTVREVVSSVQQAVVPPAFRQTGAFPAPPSRPEPMPSLAASLGLQPPARPADSIAAQPAAVPEPASRAPQPERPAAGRPQPAALPQQTVVGEARPARREEASLHIGQIDVTVVNQPVAPPPRGPATVQRPGQNAPPTRPEAPLAGQGLAWFRFKL
jgi:hypothetical protein